MKNGSDKFALTVWFHVRSVTLSAVSSKELSVEWTTISGDPKGLVTSVMKVSSVSLLGDAA